MFDSIYCFWFIDKITVLSSEEFMDNLFDEFYEKCYNAITELQTIALKYYRDGNLKEYNRLMAKIDGVSLARGYLKDIEKLKKY